MGGEVFRVGEGDDGGGDFLEGGFIVFDEVDGPEEGVGGQAGTEPGGAAGGEHMVGAGGVVAEWHGAEAADEDGTGVGDVGGDCTGVDGVDF